MSETSFETSDEMASALAAVDAARSKLVGHLEECKESVAVTCKIVTDSARILSRTVDVFTRPAAALEARPALLFGLSVLSGFVAKTVFCRQSFINGAAPSDSSRHSSWLSHGAVLLSEMFGQSVKQALLAELPARYRPFVEAAITRYAAAQPQPKPNDR